LIAILVRELVGRFRSGTTYGLLAASAAVLTVLAVGIESAVGAFSPWVAPAIGSTVAPHPSSLAAVMLSWRGPVLFLGLTMWVLGLIVVIVPALSATALNAERRDGTLDALMLSGTHSLSLVIAKLVAASLHAGLIVFTAMPAFALVWVLGGVSMSAVVATLAVAVSHLVLLVAICLAVSASIRQPSTSILIGYLLALGASILPFVGWVASTLLEMTRTAHALAILSPVVASLAALPAFGSALLGVTPLNPDALPIEMIVQLEVIGVRAVLPLWAWTITVDAIAIVILIAVTAIVVEPLHPLKTVRLRRLQTRVAGETLGGTS
jgi:ABC-type transport system involved in cytochrome c biogenesis permease component